MIFKGVARSGVAAARGTVRLVSGVASHLVWWVDHHSGGDPRKAPEDRRRRSGSDR